MKFLHYCLTELASLGLNMPILKSKSIISQTPQYFPKPFYLYIVSPFILMLVEYGTFSLWYAAGIQRSPARGSTRHRPSLRRAKRLGR